MKSYEAAFGARGTASLNSTLKKARKRDSISGLFMFRGYGTDAPTCAGECIRTRGKPSPARLQARRSRVLWVRRVRTR